MSAFPALPEPTSLPPWELLDAQALALLERNAERILASVGVLYRADAEALALWRAAGARVEGERVYIPEGLARELVSRHAPRCFVQHARNPARSVEFGGGSRICAPVYDPPWVHSRAGGRRYATLADLQNFIRLTHDSPVLAHLGGPICEPHDRPAESRYLDVLLAQLTLSDKPFMGAVIYGRPAADTIALGRVAFGTAFFERHCCTINMVNPVPPLTWTPGPLAALKTYARHGQGLLVASYPLLGLTAPVTLAGAAAQMLAEGLSGMALAQLVRPGTPVIFGALGAPFDLRRNMQPRFGTVETQRLMPVMAALARRLGVPFRTDGAITSAKTVDAQAGWESGVSLNTAWHSGADLILHAAGWLEDGRMAGYEKFMLDEHQLAWLAGQEAWMPLGLEAAEGQWRRRLAEYQAPPLDPALVEALARTAEELRAAWHG
ncbi:MAG TPA: trimethylamine methyltransferase family protein [Candidatus Competibacteraceae bacterium]|nr:trimethylamine methyltransferase family protein [Candidatus Competibacteraceae bacterium]